MIERHLTGRCSCGAIAYEIDRVFDVVYCHCSECRRRSGAPVSVTMVVPGDAFRLTTGMPREFATMHGVSWFCGDCGSPVAWEGHDANHPIAFGGRYYSIPIGALDDPEAIQPMIHQFAARALSWLNIVDDLPRRPDNRLPHPDQR